MLLDDNHIQGQIREWAELEAQDEKAQSSNQNQRAREEGRFTSETNKEVEEGWEDSGRRSNGPREARKRAMPRWLKDFVMVGQHWGVCKFL